MKVFLVSTLFALSGAVAQAAPSETFEQMCTKKVKGYGKIISTKKMKTQYGYGMVRQGFTFVLSEQRRRMRATCSVDDKGFLTFIVKDVKTK